MSLLLPYCLALLLALPGAAVYVDAVDAAVQAGAESPARVSSVQSDGVRERPHRRPAPRRAVAYMEVAQLPEPKLTRRHSDFVTRSLPVSAPHLVRTPPLLC